MVFEVRRSQSAYSLNKRHYGKVYKDRMDAKSFKRNFATVVTALQTAANPVLRNVLVTYALLLQQRVTSIEGIINVENTIFINRNRTLNSFSNEQLFDMRVTNRNHVTQLITALFQNPEHDPIQRWECDNGTVESLETGFLMFLYWISFPRKVFVMQDVFGREYSQISRVLKAVWTRINLVWGHLVVDNLHYFAQRFQRYNFSFRNKYMQMHGHGPPPRFEDVSCFTDGKKIAINRDLPINFSGHKHMYCLSFLITSFPDGMIGECFGACAGSDNDHHLRNASELGTRLVNAQINRAPGTPLYKTGTDKGLHPQLAVVPMYNNVPNTALQTRINAEFSALRSTNEWDVGRPTSMFKYLDYRKVVFKDLQPIGIMTRSLCIITNCFNILDANATSEFYECAPPRTLGDYLV